MDWKTFIAEVVKAIAWPASLVFIFLLMKDNIRKLISSVRRLKHGDTELAFEETLSEAKSEAEEAGLRPAQIPNDPELLELAETHPSLAVIEAWQRIESMLAKFLPPEDKNRVRLVPLIVPRRLREQGHITSNLYFLIRRLRELRNRAVHISAAMAEPITNKSAYEYLEIAGLVERQLEALGNITVPAKSDPPVEA
jgi:hypothetical protein